MKAKAEGVEQQIVEQSGRRVTVTRFGGDRGAREASIIRETSIALYVNGQELVTLMCTPTKETYLVAGFLYLEGIIDRPDDVLFMRVCAEENVADIRLVKEWSPSRTGRTLTSGCGGGTTFGKGRKLKPVASSLYVSTDQVAKSMVLLLQGAATYRETGGVQASALGDGEGLIVVAEDVGRHNTVDKVAGETFLLGIPTSGRLLLTTGRVSSEMLAKAAKMDVPIVVSHSSPTDLAVQLAEDLNITLIGYVRGKSGTIYTHDWRIS
ncbi:MAG: formate dehydrogenase accessory sulfurtransferase FdhD [Chloroflexi bacterium]|nr:formate dehydrogenase accessory sulfurtransferase FdhD [Chloroflexota bacterium]